MTHSGALEDGTKFTVIGSQELEPWPPTKMRRLHEYDVAMVQLGFPKAFSEHGPPADSKCRVIIKLGSPHLLIRKGAVM